MAIKKPVIRRPLPPVQPPPREELPPVTEEVEPERELPPVEPIERLLPAEPVELYPLIARLYPSFPTLRPEELQTKMVELSSWAQEDPEAFLYDLDVRATPEERDTVLRTLGVPEEYFVAKETVEEEEARISGIVTDVFPELTPDELIDYATEDWGSFLLSIAEKGDTKETRDLLKLMDFNQSEISDILQIPPTDLSQMPLGSYRITDFSLEDISKFALKDPLSFEKALAFEGRTPETMEILEQLYGTEVLDEKFLKNIFEKNTAEKFISGEWLPDALEDYWGAFWAGTYDLISLSGSIADRLGSESVSDNLQKIGLAGHEIMPTIDAEPGSAKWYALNLTRMTPMLLGLIGVGLTTGGAAYNVVGAVGGGPLLQSIVGTITAGAVSSVGEGALEAGGAYQTALDRGYSQEEANAVFDKVFRNNIGLLSVTNTAQFGLTFFLPGGATAALITKSLIFGFDVVSEGLEEGVQLAITREALGDPQKFDEEMWQNVMLGLAGGLGFAGVGAVFNSIQSRIDGKMTDEQKAIFQRDTGEGVAQGLSRREAEMKAYDKLATTPEGETIITEAVNEIMAEEQEQNVEEGRKAVESIEPALKNIEVDNQRVRDLVEEVITPIPEVPLTEALIREGDEIVTKAEAIEPTNASVIEFRRLVEQAKEATPEVQRQVLVQMEALEDEVRAIAKVPAVPEVVTPEVTRVALESPTFVIRQKMTELFGEGKLTVSNSEFWAKFDELNTRATKLKEGSPAWRAIKQDIGIMKAHIENENISRVPEVAIPKPPAVEVAKPPVEVAPEVLAERAITKEQTETINTLAKEKLIMTEEGKTKPQLRRLMKAFTGKNRINQLTQGEADLMIEAVGRLEVKYGRPPVIPTGVGLMTAEFADKIPLLKEIGILEKVRPTRHVFEKMGLRQEVWKPAFEAEVRVYEEHQAFDKELNRIGKLVGKDPARRSLVFRELENPGSQVGLTFDEKRAVTWFRKYFNEWADRLNLPDNKRRTNYVTHIFEEEISQQLKEKHPIDPELIKALDFITPKTVFNPYLQRRLGQTIGLREDPFAAATAYEARALKVFYYEPLIQRIRVYQKYLPPHSARYLRDFITRITDRPLTIDRELNRTVNEFADRVRGLPGGEAFANSLTRGNPGGMLSYNLTSVLYTLWLGFKPTSAIRNLGQHTLIIAETGPINFAKGLGLRVTQEGRTALKESLALRSRRGAFIPAIDSSFASKWTDSFREKALWMFRFADKQNVSDAFLAGYAEAKELFPNAPRELWVNRGDEVAADTQYLYTKFNSFSMSQNSIGRVFSMLTTWTENWMELMTKWISRKPSQVFLNYTKETGQAMPTKNWSQTNKAILMYMLIIGLGYALKEKTRLKAWEYTGLTSLSYLADIVGGDFPALQAPGAVADLVVGFVTDDERRLKTGWNALKSTFIPSIMKQMNYVATGERDWLTLLLYLEGKDIEIKRLKNKWEKEFEAYPLFKDDEDVYDPDLKFEYLKEHPQQIGWSDAKIRNQWRINNPLIEAKMFVVGQFTVLSSDEARAEVLRLIEEHKIDTELIDGYEKVFGVDTKPELQKFQNRLGNLEKLVVGEEAEYFTTANFATEVNAFVKTMGRAKVEQDGNKLAIEYLHATDLWESYYNLEEDDARTLWRQQYPDVEALLYLFGKVSSFKNPKSAEILLGLMKKYNIPPEAIRAFLDDPTRYDELFTQKFELEQKWFDQTTEYENFGNTEAPNYIEDAELCKEARAKFKEDNPNWVADMRRIEAIDNDASDEIMEKWVDRGHTIDEFGAGSSQAKTWLLDNPEAHKWALEKELLTDDGSDWNEPVLRLNVKWHDLDNRYEGFGDKESNLYIEDDEARTKARDKLKEANPEWVDDLRRIEAYGKEASDTTIEKWVERGRKVDRFGAGSSEVVLWLVDNPEIYDWAVENELLEDNREENKAREPVLRINVDYAEWDDAYNAIQFTDKRKQEARRKEYLLANTEYARIRRRRDALELRHPDDYFKRFPDELVETYIDYYMIPEKPDDWPESVVYYEEEWFLQKHPELHDALVDFGVLKKHVDLSKVPTKDIFKKWWIYNTLTTQYARDAYRLENPDLDEWGVSVEIWTKTMSEKRRRLSITPTERFLEDVLAKETEFDEAMRELEELLEGLR